MSIFRARINQPSTLQPMNRMHGMYCIVNDTGEDSITLYFTDGPVHSTTVLRSWMCYDRVKLSSAED